MCVSKFDSYFYTTLAVQSGTENTVHIFILSCVVIWWTKLCVRLCFTGKYWASLSVRFTYTLHIRWPSSSCSAHPLLDPLIHCRAQWVHFCSCSLQESHTCRSLWQRRQNWLKQEFAAALTHKVCKGLSISVFLAHHLDGCNIWTPWSHFCVLESR